MYQGNGGKGNALLRREIVGVETRDGMTRKQAIHIIKLHGWTPTDQTASLNGEMVKNGTSFNEEMGIHAHYTTREIRNWLGY